MNIWESDMEQIWWEKVPNAALFVRKLVDSLLEEKSLILHTSVPLPWRGYFVRSVRDEVQQQCAGKSFENIAATKDPGKYLLEHYCKWEKRADYRPAISPAKFLSISDDIVLHQRIFWVQPETREEFEAWTQFIAEYVRYRGKDKEAAAFVLEWRDEQTVPIQKGLTVLDFSKEVGEYDYFAFCVLAASSVHKSRLIQSYLTELATGIAEDDVELCGVCLDVSQKLMENPYDTIREIADTQYRSDGMDFVFEKTRTEVKRMVWLAQLKAVYPVLEQYRENFVERHREEIARNLPLKTSLGETYDSPEEVELGALKMMANTNMLILAPEEYNRLRLYRDARNRLAHLDPLYYEEIRELEN